MIAGMNQKGCYGGFKMIQGSRRIGLKHLFSDGLGIRQICLKIDWERKTWREDFDPMEKTLPANQNPERGVIIF